jgi:hypothetical protein
VGECVRRCVCFFSLLLCRSKLAYLFGVCERRPNRSCPSRRSQHRNEGEEADGITLNLTGRKKPEFATFQSHRGTVIVNAKCQDRDPDVLSLRRTASSLWYRPNTCGASIHRVGVRWRRLIETHHLPSLARSSNVQWGWVRKRG